MDEAGVKKKELTADLIGFQIAPRINAAGRMDHANVAYNLLMAALPEEAAMLASQLDQNNVDRQKRTEELVREGSKQIELSQMNEPVLVVIGDDWSPGIVGLIASRLKDKFEKPVFALARFNGHIMGSGRSIKAFNMVKAMHTMPELFTKYGGHPMACGFTLSSTDNLEAFTNRMRLEHNTQTNESDLTPIIPIDAEVTLEEVNWELYDILDRFKPFGQMNERPKYMAKNVYVSGLEPVGKNGKHLRILVKQDGSNVIRKTIGWKLCHEDNEINWGKELNIGDRINMVFEIDVNEWNGNREIQLTIVDLEKHVA
jgi:single-stranded-DNA-specific exonuclease